MKSSEAPAGRSLVRLPSNISLDSVTDELRNTKASGRPLQTAALHYKKWRLWRTPGAQTQPITPTTATGPHAAKSPISPTIYPIYPCRIIQSLSWFSSWIWEIARDCGYTLANFDDRPTHHPCRILAQVSYININFHIINGLMQRSQELLKLENAVCLSQTTQHRYLQLSSIHRVTRKNRLSIQNTQGNRKKFKTCTFSHNGKISLNCCAL